MRKMILAAAAAGTAMTLTACSQGAEEPAAESEIAADDAAEATADGAEETAAVLDASTVTAEELAAGGMSAEVAEAIVSGQPYASVTDLKAKLIETMSEEEAGEALVKLFVPVNLNSASEDEIKLIPGMTDKMVHEFLEYRPYADMDEFNREIGKYVDEAEVARFRNYVTL